MKKKVLIVLMLTFVLWAGAKTTYIPNYKSYIHIVNGVDTTAVTNNLEDLELAEQSGMFNVRIEHEPVTKEKIKAIKRAKRAAGWMEFSAVMSGVSTAFSNNSLQYMVRSTNTQVAVQLAEFYSANANAEKTLSIDMWVDNTSGAELMVNDMERGLVWYVQPSQSLHIKMNNPDASSLRISDVHNDNVRFVLAMAGSEANKRTIEWEDDDFWIICISHPTGNYGQKEIDKYVLMSKTDFSKKDMSTEEYKAFIKERKK